jgi:hypothetical protein
MTTQMFTFMFGCLGQLFQHTGMQLPPQPSQQQLQADPRAPLPLVGGFMNIPISTFLVSPLLQTRMFPVPQTTTPQTTVALSTFLEQLRQC